MPSKDTPQRVGVAGHHDSADGWVARGIVCHSDGILAYYGQSRKGQGCTVCTAYSKIPNRTAQNTRDRLEDDVAVTFVLGSVIR